MLRGGLFCDPSPPTAPSQGGIRGGNFIHHAGLVLLHSAAGFPNIDRPYVSPLGNLGAFACMAIALLTLVYMFLNEGFTDQVCGGLSFGMCWASSILPWLAGISLSCLQRRSSQQSTG
jgi:hypothetical protein